MDKINDKRFKELLEEEKDYWDRNARKGVSGGDFFGVWQDEVVNEVFYGDILEKCYQQVYKCGGRVLELGCGIGVDSIQLAKYGGTIDAIDLSLENIKRARANYYKTKERQTNLGKINFIVGDLNRVAFGKDKYDCVFAKSSLCYIFYLENLMEQIKRTLKPGGYFVVFDNIGMKEVIMFLANTLVFILPTTKSYHDKLKLKGKLTALKTLLTPPPSWRKKSGAGRAVPWRSPFDVVSQKRLIKVIGDYFSISDIKHFNFIMHYLLARLRLSKRYKKRLCSYANKVDRFIVKMFPGLGEFVSIFAINNK